MTFSSFLASRVIEASMIWNLAFLRGDFMRAFDRPGDVQRALLKRILMRNASTTFGQQHGFASIRDIEDYRRCVPVQRFDDLQPYIESQKLGVSALTISPPVYYARTSGTTGRGKFIPMTRDGLRQVSVAQRLLAASLWRDTDFFGGSILAMASSVVEGRLENGVAYGSSSGSAYRTLFPILRGKFAQPKTTFDISDVAAKYQVYALAALARADLTGVAAANPSSILKVCNIIESNSDTLLSVLEKRSTMDLGADGGSAAAEIAAQACPARLKDLRAALNDNGHLPKDVIWPRLSAIATWTGGSCGIALEKLRRHLPDRVKIVEYGYAASEFVGASNIDVRKNLCMPLLREHVYEFVRRSAWEAGTPTFLQIDELEPDEEYYIFVTTQSGLYRYDINDIVRAEPGIRSCPALRFLQKGNGITSITGEKLSEHHVIAAMSDALAKSRLAATGYIVLADEQAEHYSVFLECSVVCDPKQLGAQIDDLLRSMNSEYDDKRSSGRLLPITVFQLREGATDAIRSERVATGMREAQYKPIVLDYLRNWSDKISPWVVGPPPAASKGSAT
jgi:hypothetical protein